MASALRSAIVVSARCRVSRSTVARTTFAPKPNPTSPFSSSSRPVNFAASRVSSVLVGVESMKPLHSAIASARLKSSIAVESSYWSWLSQVHSGVNGLMIF